MKDALYVLADAWEEGHADSIFKAYSKLKIHPVRSSVSEPEPENISTEPIMDVLNLFSQPVFLPLMLKTGLMSKMNSQLCHSCSMNTF